MISSGQPFMIVPFPLCRWPNTSIQRAKENLLWSDRLRKGLIVLLYRCIGLHNAWKIV